MLLLGYNYNMTIWDIVYTGPGRPLPLEILKLVFIMLVDAGLSCTNKGAATYYILGAILLRFQT
eukprot:11368248-Karenia_brevis.AAC.1